MSQVYVRDFVKYIKSLRQEWANPPDGESAIDNHGSFIALTVVNKFMGPKGQGYRTSSESSCEEEEWLALYKGLVLSARILDVVSAPADLGKEDMVSALRRLPLRGRYSIESELPSCYSVNYDSHYSVS